MPQMLLLMILLMLLIAFYWNAKCKNYSFLLFDGFQYFLQE